MVDSVATSRRRIARRIAGYLWLISWTIVLGAMAAPWLDLGGIESDFMRWMESVVLGMGVIFGFTIGRFARDAAERNPSRTHATLLRVAVYPAGAIAAIALIVLGWAGERGAVNVVTTALLSYWAGFDVAFAALPLMFGQPYAFDRALPSEVLEAPVRRRDDGGPGFPPLGGW